MCEHANSFRSPALAGSGVMAKYRSCSSSAGNISLHVEEVTGKVPGRGGVLGDAESNMEPFVARLCRATGDQRPSLGILLRWRQKKAFGSSRNS